VSPVLVPVLDRNITPRVCYVERAPVEGPRITLFPSPDNFIGPQETPRVNICPNPPLALGESFGTVTTERFAEVSPNVSEM
jgi:hypothetical protein